LNKTHDTKFNLLSRAFRIDESFLISREEVAPSVFRDSLKLEMISEGNYILGNGYCKENRFCER